jgi:hypothetical protein
MLIPVLSGFQIGLKNFAWKRVVGLIKTRYHYHLNIYRSYIQIHHTIIGL